MEVSQRRMDLSSEPEAKVRESGDHAIVEMPARWPSRVCRALPVEVSQILIVASAADGVGVSLGVGLDGWVVLTAAGYHAAVGRESDRCDAFVVSFQDHFFSVG